MKKLYFFVCLLGGLLFQSGFSQQSYTFTTAGATGSIGPTQPQVNTAYASTNLSGLVTVAGSGLQKWVVPTTGAYRIRAIGASGGSINITCSAAGGLGADMSGDFNLTSGQVLLIMVGQKGLSNGEDGGGGGGSYVTTSASVAMVVAGGGGGASNNTRNCGSNLSGVNASTTTAGTAGAAGGGAGGTGGNGGVALNGGSCGGGGGFVTDGTSAAATYSGKSFLNGGFGGQGLNVNHGGFGGGGSGYWTGGSGGSGGGYSGGGTSGSSPWTGGGGGGSYNAGTSPTNTIAAAQGDGRVIITELCNITLTATGVNGSGAICSGGSVSLTTNAISNYTWTSPTQTVFTPSLVVSPTITTTYTLMATSPSLCLATAVVTIVVNQAVPSLTVVNTANAGGICPTKTVNLLATGAITYTWTGGTPTVTNGVTFSPVNSATYLVTGENGCGTSTAVTSVSIHPFPTVNPVANSTTLCAGSTLSLTATGNATNYAWSGGSIPITNGVGFIPPVSIITYSVIGTSALSCTALATMPVTVFATPGAVPVASPSLICIGGSSTLSAAGALTYTWASSSQTVFTSNFTVTPSAPGVSTYTITKSNSTCSDTKTISVTTNSLPTIVAIALPNLVCALRPATLSVAGGQSYTWTAPGTPTYNFNGANPIVYPLASSLYTVAASDGTCINVTTVSLSVDPNPTVSISASSSSICSGQSATLSAFGGNSYTWTTPSGTSGGNSLVVSPTAATAYTLTGDNSFNCTADVSQVILVYQSPTVGITVSKALVCSGGPSTLTANGAASYTWDANAGSATNSLVIVNPTSTASGPIIYTVTGINAIGCTGTQTAQVSIYVPTLAVTGNTSSCIGGQINLTASGTNAGGFSWNTGSGSFGGTSLSTTVGAAGIFTLSANSNSNSVTCPATLTVAISIYANPSITAVAQRTTICKNEQVDLQASGGVSYAWSNAMNGATITVSPLSNTNYTVTGTDANSCVGTGTVQVKVSGCNGINELSNINNDLLVYPNPSSGAFIIQADSEIKLWLVNELGQSIRSITLTKENHYQASVTDLAKGVYFISGQNNNVQINKKVIVIR